MAKRQRSLSPDRSQWGTVDLLEFIRPAFLAFIFFMHLAQGFSNPALMVIVLNGQSQLIVRASQFFFFIFFFYSLIFDSVILTPSSVLHTAKL